MTDIIDLVLHDHHAVEGLFEKLQAAVGAKDQATLFAPAKEALERHASAEEKVLYPRVRKDVPDGGDAGTELFTLAIAQLVATTKHHVGVEEGELLPDFRENSEAREREELGSLFEEAKAKAAVS
jgi:hemerythrin superfamily protein